MGVVVTQFACKPINLPVRGEHNEWSNPKMCYFFSKNSRRIGGLFISCMYDSKWGWGSKKVVDNETFLEWVFDTVMSIMVLLTIFHFCVSAAEKSNQNRELKQYHQKRDEEVPCHHRCSTCHNLHSSRQTHLRWSGGSLSPYTEM